MPENELSKKRWKSRSVDLLVFGVGVTIGSIEGIVSRQPMQSIDDFCPGLGLAGYVWVFRIFRCGGAEAMRNASAACAGYCVGRTGADYLKFYV